ncbi:sigma-70 family RNA polymerase sigma factor [candidate division KSB1 bacterium]|nr:sigma-70 family RNA polymerase sigma factor [candidate division KSB1 bacterium]
MNDIKVLIEKIIRGDTRAFQTIMNDYQRLVFHIVTRMVDRVEDREDICQDVFIKVFENLSKFQFNAKLSTWIAQIAYNHCLNYLEKKRIPLFNDLDIDGDFEMQPGDMISPEEYTEQQDMTARLQQAISAMPIQFRTIITLYHLQHMTYQEIVEITHLPEGTVKNYLFRARKWLKDRLISTYAQEDIWN